MGHALLQVHSLIFWTAFVPRDGDAKTDVMRRNRRTAFNEPGVVLFSSDSSHSTLDPTRAAPIFFNDCDDALTAAGIATFVPELTTDDDAQALSPGRFGRAPKFYICATRDAVIHPEAQFDMAHDACVRATFELDGGHMAHFTQPAAFAGVVARTIGAAIACVEEQAAHGSLSSDA